MSPHMTPLLEGAGWQDGLLTGAFPCSPLRAEDLANLMPPHMQTPQQQEGPPGGVPAFSPALLPIDDIDPNEPMSFLISPGKSGTPFKISPMKNTTAMHPPPVAPLHLRSSLDSRKATAISPFAKDVQKLVGGCFSSPQKAVFHPNGSTAPDAPPSGLMPAHTARRISPRKRPGVFSDGKPPRAPTTPQPHSPPVKKARTAPERSPQVSPLWSRSPMNVKPDLKGEDAALSFLASPLGLRGDQTETPSMRRSGPNFTNIDMSPMCTRMCDAPGGVNIISGGEQSSTPQLRPTSNIAPDSAKNLWQSRGGAPATVQ